MLSLSSFLGAWGHFLSRMTADSSLLVDSVAGVPEHPPLRHSPYSRTGSGSTPAAALLSSGRASLVPAVATEHPGAGSRRCCPTATTSCRLLLAGRSCHRTWSPPATEHRPAPRAVVPSGQAAAIRERNGRSRCNMRGERDTHVCHPRCRRRLRLRAACFASSRYGSLW